AKQAKVDHKTVAAVRREGEARGEIPHVETRTDSKGRKQPTRKPRELSRSPLRSGEADDADDLVASPEVIKSNALDTIDRHYAVARAYKKIFKVSSLDQAARNEVSAAIGRLITMWQSSRTVLARDLGRDDSGSDKPESGSFEPPEGNDADR